MTKTSDVRIIVTVSRALLDDIEAWWHEERLPTRAEALRRLLAIGLVVATNKEEDA